MGMTSSRRKLLQLAARNGGLVPFDVALKEIYNVNGEATAIRRKGAMQTLKGILQRMETAGLVSSNERGFWLPAVEEKGDQEKRSFDPVVIFRRETNRVAHALSTATESINDAFDALSRLNRLAGAPSVETSPIIERPSLPMRAMRLDEYDS